MTNKIGKKRKITFWTRLGFGMGGMLNSGALTFTHSYMVLFLSTECGLSAGEAALISSFAIYLNAILCPLMGFVADNFYATKIGRIFGRRRFWILLAIPMMVAEPLIFVATPFGFPYYFVLYLIYNVAYTFCTANLSPLTIEMTDDFKERTYLTGYKHLFGNAAGFLMAALVGFGFGTFGETNPFSYFIIATVNASVMAISLLCVY
ncbi:MFS transporter, partial [Collinsella aerofaciens]|uniref:MFS transporter n=2 Tax=Coriobacteriaceae TaxID=84107 RepID=UPI0034A159F1